MHTAIRSILFPTPPLFLAGRTDVAAAYSMRALNPVYTGYRVRVRRSSDSVERDFGFGRQSPLQLWSDISGFIGAGSGFVSKWYDQSGLGWDLAQATTANQPQIILASNNVPASLFDGVSRVLQTSAFTLTQPVSFNLLYRRVANVNSFDYLVDGLAGDTRALFRAAGTSDNSIYAGAQINSDNGVSQTTGVRGVVGGTYNGASSLLEVNGTTVASFTGTAGTGGSSGITLGGKGSLGLTFFSNAEMQEYVLFNTAHTSAQLKADNAAIRSAAKF